jgi:hypothetical protein
MKWISNPKRIGWLNFWIWVLVAIHVCYLSQLPYRLDFDGGIFIIFVGMCLIAGLLSLLVSGAAAIQNRVWRMLFKIIVLICFFGSIFAIKKYGLLGQLQLVIGASWTTLGTPSMGQMLVRRLVTWMALFAPAFFAFAILVSGEFGDKRPET